MPEMKKQAQRPRQHQSRQPGLEESMIPPPESHDPKERGCGKLREKVALITGGDSGIGRAVAVAYAKEGADVVIVYLNEHTDAEDTKRLVEQEGRRCLVIAGDVGEEGFCRKPSNAPFRNSDISIFWSIMPQNNILKKVWSRSRLSSSNAPFAPIFFPISTWARPHCRTSRKAAPSSTPRR